MAPRTALLPMLLAAAWVSCAGAEAETQHWAFQPVQSTTPPRAVADWVETPIDAFIARRLEAEGMSAPALANRRDFVRRCYHVLTGLPPSFEEMEVWLADPRTEIEVTGALVDTLLASPAHGERWARFWLDLARYSDTKGYAYAVEQFDLYHAWRYRDWVVDALNADMPYDHFVQCQLAADRLLERGECATKDLAAMGFLTTGRRFLGVEPDIIDDRIDVTTRTVLGLTVACARCHDHKFDPVSAKDYYALYGIFGSSREQVTPLRDPPKDDELEKLDREFSERFGKEADAAEKAFLDRVEEYLLAVLDWESVPPPDFSEIVVPDAVVPGQIRRWHAYLGQSRRRQDPVFAAWAALADVGVDRAEEALDTALSVSHPFVLKRLRVQPLQSMEDVARVYATLIKDAMIHKLDDPHWEPIRRVLKASDSPLIIAREHPHDIEWVFTNTAQTGIKKAFASYERRLAALGDRAAYTVALVDRPVPRNMRLLLRGDYKNQGAEVKRGQLELFKEDSADVTKGSGRLELAMSLTSDRNPLSARVMMNRLWHHYFGSGLVATNSDFGLRAAPPSHPELLDYLASEFVASGWSLKAMHRLIATSAVFRFAAGEAPMQDPDNRWLSVYPRRRLDFEAMRDALLQVSGELDRRLAGPPGPLFGGKASARRALYGKIDRQYLPGELQAFDFANPEMHSPRRYRTNVPQQALFFLNSPFLRERAVALAEATAGMRDEDRVTALFRRVYQRDPTPGQQEASLELVRAEGEEGGRPWVRMAQGLLMANEFVFID